MARLVQERAADTRADGSAVYSIISTLTQREPLPDSGVFVFQIADEDDPALDTFVRVAEVQDLSEVAFGRDRAVQLGQVYYRLSGLTLEYTSFNAAEAASTTVKDRVNTLVKNWQAASTTWLGGATYTLPSDEPTVEEAYRTAYSVAYKAYAEALVDRDDAQSTLEATKAELERLDELTGQLQPVTDSVRDMRAGLAALRARTAMGGTTEALDRLQQLDRHVGTLLDEWLTVLGTTSTYITTQRTSLEQTLQTNLETYSRLQTTVDQTRLAADAASQTLLSICPDTELATLQNEVLAELALERAPAVATLAAG